MDPIATCAEQTLLRSTQPALRLSELLESVGEAMDRTLDARRLRSILEAHPEHFRILEPWRGAWPTHAGGSETGAHAWVVAVSQPDPPPDGVPPLALSLRESVQWLARGIDTRSRADVSRWYAIAMSERAVRSTLLSRAA